MSKNKRILFICPDELTTAGGVKQIYRQVDVLNKAGFDANVLHENLGFRCNWFQNKTRIVYNKQLFKDIRKNSVSKLSSILKLKLKLSDYKKSIINNLLFYNERLKLTKISVNDLLVFPEIWTFDLDRIHRGVPKVIFNQNCFYTFRKYGLNDNLDQNPYSLSDIVATITVSENSSEYLDYVFPGIQLFRIKPGIDSGIFYYKSLKKKQIAFMSRKLIEDLEQVINILKVRQLLNGWELVEIKNLNELEVSNILRDSAVFLSFNDREGFGLPPAEAMACGCLVVGYAAGGGIEYFKPEFSYRVTDRDIISFVKVLEEIIINYKNEPQKFIEMGKQAAEYIKQHYSMESEAGTIVTCWQEILSNPMLN